MNNYYHNLMNIAGSVTQRFDAALVRGDLMIPVGATESATNPRCDMYKLC